MGNKKKKTPFKIWESKNSDGSEKHYIRLADTLTSSSAWMNLSHTAVRVYIHMDIAAGGNKDFKFPHHTYKNFISNNGFQAALKELEEKGFVDVKEHNANLRIPNVYSFSSRWKDYKGGDFT